MTRYGVLACVSMIAVGAAPLTCTDDSVSMLQMARRASSSAFMQWHDEKEWEAFVNNLGGTGPLSGTQELRFHNVSVYHSDESDPGIILDLLVQTVSPYANNQSPNKNGGHGEFGAIQFNPESGTVFRWTFVKMDTYAKVTIPEFSLTFYDLDQKSGRPPCDENITAWNVYSYALVPDAYTTVTVEAPDRILVCSNTPDSVPNPRKINSLSDEQKKASVMLSFQNTAEFLLSLRNNHNGRRKFQSSGPSRAFAESAVPKQSPTFAPTAFPTASPTNFPTGSPTGSPTAYPTASPTVSPTASPTAAPTDKPTGSPTSMPTRPEPSAFGDPHVMNTAGDKFNIERDGNHTFLAIPRGADSGRAELEVYGRVGSRGNACAGQHYITDLALAGSWLGAVRSLAFSTATEEFNVPETIGLRAGGSGNLSPQDMMKLVPPQMLELTQYQPERPSALNQHVSTMVAKLFVGPIKIKVSWEHTKEKQGFSNSLMLIVSGLGKVQSDLGGLLGSDDHTWVASLPLDCSAASDRLPLQNAARALAFLGEEDVSA